MERSGADDAWDDGGEPLYPPAPLPAHERTWRHPSEVGKAAWELSEPPVAIGRGLLVTTGAIGSALGVAVLWLLSPMSGTDPAAAPAVTSVASVVRTTEVVDAAPTTIERLEGSAISARPLETIDLTDFTLPAEDVPSTVLVAAPRPEAHASIAVSLGDRPYMVTTAAAVAAADLPTSIDIVAPGDPVAADVVSVEGDLAYLAPSASIEVISFPTAATPEPGETVVVLGDEPTEVVYQDDGAAPELDPGVIVEGTPVVDADGALVALCTVVIDADGAWVDLVPIPPAVTEPTDTVDPTTPVDTDATTSLEPSSTSTTVPGSSTTSLPTTTAAPTTGSTAVTATTSSSAPTSSAPASTVATSSSGSTASTAPASSAGTAWAGLRFDTSTNASGSSSQLVVVSLPSGSPAAAAGIVVGERIGAIDGVTVTTVDDLQVQIRKHQPGDVVTLRVVSSTGVERSVTVTLGAVAPSV